MTVSIEVVSSRRQLEEFIELPFGLHGGTPWVPALKKQDRELLLRDEHPFWLTARRELFLARKNGAPVARIAAIVDDKYNEYAGEKCGAFGFFECADNFDAARAVLEAAREWLELQGMLFMRGPLNPSTNYTCGMLVQGFELSPSIMMPWNPAYYANFLEKWRMRKEQDLFAYTLDRQTLSLPDWLKTEITRLKAENRFTFRQASGATMADDIRAMLQIYRQSWADNWGFSPLSEQEAEKLVAELKGIVDPDFFVLFFHDGQPAAGMVALPDMNPLLKRMNGKIGLLAPLQYLMMRKQLRQNYRIMLFGILPQYRLYGLPLLLLAHMLEKAAALPGLRSVEGSWVLEDNAAIDDLIEDFGGKITKRYRIYRREIGSC